MMLVREFMGGPIDGESRCVPKEQTVIDVVINRKDQLVEWGVTLSEPDTTLLDKSQFRVERYARPQDGERFLHAGVVGADGRIVSANVKSDRRF